MVSPNKSIEVSQQYNLVVAQPVLNVVGRLIGTVFKLYYADG